LSRRKLDPLDHLPDHCRYEKEHIGGGIWGKAELARVILALGVIRIRDDSVLVEKTSVCPLTVKVNKRLAASARLINQVPGLKIGLNPNEAATADPSTGAYTGKRHIRVSVTRGDDVKCRSVLGYPRDYFGMSGISAIIVNGAFWESADDVTAQGCGFWHQQGRRIEDMSGEVRGFENFLIHEQKPTNARPSEHIGNETTDRTAADNGNRVVHKVFPRTAALGSADQPLCAQVVHRAFLKRRLVQ